LDLVLIVDPIKESWDIESSMLSKKTLLNVKLKKK
jgi:hypothetical protein